MGGKREIAHIFIEGWLRSNREIDNFVCRKAVYFNKTKLICKGLSEASKFARKQNFCLNVQNEAE